LLVVTACGVGSAGGGDSDGEGGGDTPQSFQNEQGGVRGLDIDVAEEIARRMGVEVASVS
jgi:ABC-type amino acid transport substrate-binding protein